MANRSGKVEAITDFIFLGSRITVDNDYSHEIKRCLLFGRKAMANLDSILKQRHHFSNQGLCSPSYNSFSSGHIHMWDLDHLEACCFSVTMSNSLQRHELQHARPPCPLPSPRVCSNSCPLSWWGHPTISSSVAPFSSCPQSFPASGPFPVSQSFTSGGQSIGVYQVDKVLEFHLQHQSFQRTPGLISFRMDWLDLLAV